MSMPFYVPPEQMMKDRADYARKNIARGREVMAFSVSLRSRELGIRVALGARPSSLLRDVLQQAAVLSGTGICIGLPAAIATGRLLGPIFQDVRVTDPTVLAGVPAAVLAISLLASFVPARRAMRANPVEAMRVE